MGPGRVTLPERANVSSRGRKHEIRNSKSEKLNLADSITANGNE